MLTRHSGWLLIALLTLHSPSVIAQVPERGSPWKHHSIDDTARGADGVRLADANGDGLLDIATGWEEAGLIRLYLNPGPAKARQLWPATTVGQANSPEDAVLVDLDGDRTLEIISCCEGRTRSVFAHWKNADGTWTTSPFTALANQQAAMYCLPLNIDGQNGIDLVIGSKGQGAKIGWLQSPANPRDLAAWKYYPLADAGWIMSLVASDIDNDGDQDILASDRKGPTSGCLWLENPGRGPRQAEPWSRHAIGLSTPHAPREESITRSVMPTMNEVMFLHHVNFDADNRLDLLVPTYDKRLFLHRRLDRSRPAWETRELPFPPAAGRGKAVRAADINLDGALDLVISTENYESTSGLVWMSRTAKDSDAWHTHEISGPAGPRGMKLDDIQLLDLDADGDLDILTTEERTGFGVVWFENPTR